MTRSLFRLSDPESIKQRSLIVRVVNKHKGEAVIAYQSNWYIIVACLDSYVARQLRAQLDRVWDWEMEIAPGRKNMVRHYIKIKLTRT